MGLFNILDPVLDFLFKPLLNLPPALGILILSLIITLIITIIYKYTTDQPLLKSIRENQKKLQEEMRKNRDNPQKVMKLQKEAFSSSGEMMKQSFRSMFYTFIPIIILFGWIATHFAYYPLETGQEFNTTLIFKKGITGQVIVTAPEGIEVLSQKNAEIANDSREANFAFKAQKEGEHLITFTYNNQVYDKKVVVGSTESELRQTKMKKSWIDYIYGSREGYLQNGEVLQIRVSYEKIMPLSFTGVPWIRGWGWLGTYILFSLILSIAIRKVMKVY